MKKVQGAGAIVWRKVQKGISSQDHLEEFEILLVHRPKYLDWSYPKGKLDKGESIPEAAVREVEEETGVAVFLDFALTEIEYDAEDNADHLFKYRKRIQYFVAQPVNLETSQNKAIMSVRLPVKPATKDEIDDVRWVKLGEVLKMLTYRDDKDIFRQFLKVIESGRVEGEFQPLETRPAEPTPKKKWHGDKKDRPLSKKGIAEVVQLAQNFSAFGINKLVVAKNRRFYFQTVQRYAQLTSVDIAISKTLPKPRPSENERIAYITSV